MKLIKTVDSVGHVLCHDLTQIIPGVSKDARFRKGHIVTEEDIPVLLSMGKENLYVWEKREGILHENEGADILRTICQNEYMHASDVKEGKVELIADRDGLFLVNVDALNAVNEQEELMIATRHGNTAVKQGDKLAGMRIIPLVIEKEKLELARHAAGNEPILSLLPWKKNTAGIITTGNEVYSGLIQDAFTPVVKKKLEAYGITVSEHILCNDDKLMILDAIATMRSKAVDLIICTGGMSVDPDDRTPGAIRDSGAQMVTYGAPVLPGAMLALGYFPDETPIIGLPGCVMYAKATIFDLLLPRLVAGVPITRKDIVSLGYGGLCLGCRECHYPDCSFGKSR